MKGHQRVLFRVPNVNLRSHDLEIGPHQREDSAKGARVIGEQIQRGCPLNRANNRIFVLAQSVRIGSLKSTNSLCVTRKRRCQYLLSIQ